MAQSGLTLEKLRDTYQKASQKTSEVIRQLIFAGIALVWIFKVDKGGRQYVEPALFKPSLLLVSALICDLLHTLSRTLLWGGYRWFKDEENVPETKVFRPHSAINWPGNLFFIAKFVFTAWAYLYILDFLLERVSVSDILIDNQK